MKSDIAALPLIDSLPGGGMLRVVCDEEADLVPDRHQHPHGELFLLRAGYLRSHAQTGQWVIPPGQLCWIPPHAMHGADKHHMRWTRLHLSESLCAPLPAEPCILTCTPLMRAVIDRLAESSRLRTCLSQAEQRLVDVLLDELAHARHAAILLPMPQAPKLKSLAERWLRCPDDVADLDALAADSATSRRSLTRSFRRETGMSVGQWRQIARFMRGIDMLAAGNTVTETAMALGYDSVSSFVVLCQRHTGMSPKVLARALRTVLPD